MRSPSCAESSPTPARRDAVPILTEGLARLEYRGYDSAGIAVLGRSGDLRVRKAKGRVAEMTAGPARAVQGGDRHRAHPLGDARRAERRQRPPARRRDRGGRAQRHHRERRRAARQAGGRRRRPAVRDRQRGPAAPDRAVLRRTSWRTPYARRCRRSSARTASRSSTPATPACSWSPATAARSCSASARRRCSPPPTSPRWSATPARSSTWTTASWPPYAPTGSAPSRSTRGPPRRSRRSSRRDEASYDADGYAHFMLKEIHEQPAAVERALRGRLDARFHTAHLGGLNLDPREAREVRRVKILGCGSAYYAGQVGAQLIEELARIPADAEPASEFRYRNPVVEADTLYIAVSQSGETYDTLAAVQELKRKGGRVLGVVNAVGSAIARECDGGVYLHAGPETAVASTKAYTSTAVVFALLALHLGRIHDLSPADGRRIADGLRALPVPDRGDPEAGGADRRDRRGLHEVPQHAVHRPGARLPGRAGERAEAEGGLLRPRGGLPGERAQARSARAGQSRAAGRRDRARRRAAGEEPLDARRDPRAARAGADDRPPHARRRLHRDPEERARARPDPAARSRCS